MSNRWVGLGLLCLTLAVIFVAYQTHLPMEIDLGLAGANPLVEGFSFREDGPDGRFRWSGEQAALFFRGIGNQAGFLHLRLDSPTGHFLVQLNGRQVPFESLPGGAGQQVALAVNRDQVGPAGDLVVGLETDTFSAPPDVRNLGLQMVSAVFEPQAGLVIPAPRTVLLIVLDLTLLLGIVRAWSGSWRIAWAVGLLALFAVGWGLACRRVETAWIVRVVFWLQCLVILLALAWAWVLRRFYPIQPRTLRWLGLALLFALAVRMPLAAMPGFITDVQDYVVWSYKLTHWGLGSAYVVVDGLWIADYPPVLLYVFQAVGRVYQALFAPDFLYPVSAGDPALRAVTANAALLADPVHRTLLRMPAVLADLLTGSLVFVLARSNTTERSAWLISISYLFNPAVLYNSGLYGQTDAVHTLLVVLSLALVEVARAGWGFFALAVAGLTKPQALVFGPLALLRTFQRQRWSGLVRAGTGGLLGLVAVMVPMAASGALSGAVAQLRSTVGHHAVLSANAHNLWWLVMGGKIGIEDTALSLGGVSYRAVGLLLLAAAYGLALATLLRKPSGDSWSWMSAAYVAFAFFVLPTEIHENYGFAVLALLAIAMATQRCAIGLYLVLSVTSVVNYALHDPQFFHWLSLSAPDVQLAGWRILNSAINVLALVVWTLWLLVQTIRHWGEDGGLLPDLA